MLLLGTPAACSHTPPSLLSCCCSLGQPITPLSLPVAPAALWCGTPLSAPWHCPQVAEAMVGKDKVVTVGPAAPLSEAAQLMVHHDINLLPVVEGPGRTVVGILTRHDILRGMYASKSPLL